MKNRILPDNVRYRTMTNADLRAAFMLDELFVPGRLELVYTDVDRAIVGAAVPTDRPLTLPNPESLRVRAFCDRRELGIINVGAPGAVTADDRTFTVGPRECVYVGQGTNEVSFSSSDPSTPAAFYLVSFPAHAAHPTVHARLGDARSFTIGSAEEASRRTLRQYIHPDGIKSCQLVMGFTEIESGSVWNTMPPHTHGRRCEIYMYFDLPAESRVLHLMGEPEETRVLWVADRQAVVSPSWSLHSGAGTRNYRFVWAMGGENQMFDDMDGVRAANLR